MESGRIIFLNGTSSAGKTTLAHALQEYFAEPWIHMALDQFRDGLPDKYRGLNSPEGTSGARGLNVVPVTDVAEPFTEVRFGACGQRMLRGMRRAIAAMVSAGNNVIIDDIILQPEFLDDYLHTFAGLEVYFVGVWCPKTVISQRELARPGRFPGTAVGHFDACHQHGVYDIRVDTSVASPAACAIAVGQHTENHPPRAFDSLRNQRSISAS